MPITCVIFCAVVHCVSKRVLIRNGGCFVICANKQPQQSVGQTLTTVVPWSSELNLDHQFLTTHGACLQFIKGSLNPTEAAGDNTIWPGDHFATFQPSR